MSSTQNGDHKKTSDFAHLFELFDQLTSRRGKSGGDDLHSVPVPEDLEPVFRNLVTLVGARTRTQTQTRPKPPGASRGRRKTVSVAGGSGGVLESSDSEEESTPEFPRDGKQYPFTFKMMLHKLYELEEWGKKVKDILEKSQSEYKSLALQHGDEKSSGDSITGCSDVRNDTSTGRRVEFAVERIIPKKTNMNPIKGSGRPRSQTVASTNGNDRMKENDNRNGTGFAGRVSTPRKNATAELGDTRVTKKRCIGRRKSFGEKNDWFYDAAVASREVDEGRGVGTRPSKMDYDENGAVGGRPVIVRRRVLSVATTNPWHVAEHA
ncbi:hypothetical protein V5O48_007825 [Marasmius crinis-equi]|uniref:Uncharacterized protein n=1 Tax=Marasmius crinis-equi TaxID=585013 RepID=A0ABR3FFJ9_9AGAR